MRKIIFLSILLLSSSPLLAQTVGSFQNWCQAGNQKATISGLLSTNLFQGSYPNCQVNVYFTGTTNRATIYSTISLLPLSNPFTANADGSFIFYASNTSLYDVTITGGLNGGLPAPFTFVDISVSGLPGSGGGGGGSLTPGGISGNVQYNVGGTALGGIANIAVGGTMVSAGVNAPPFFRTNPQIDVRDTTGIDCTGTTDSSAALNTVFSNLRGNKVIIPTGCRIRVDSQVQILNQTNFIVEAQGAIPNQTTASAEIFGCNGSAGAVLYINRSSFGQIRGLGVFAKGVSCTSNFTQSVRVDNNGVSGFTPTHLWFDGMAVGTSVGGGTITNYVGFNFTGTPNLEQMRITHSDIQCQFSLNSFGAWWNGTNADDGEVSSSGISSCFQGIRVDQGNPRITGNLLGNDGGYTHFSNNNQGAVIFVGSCSSRSMSIIANEQSSGGPFINSNNQNSIGCSYLTLIGNEMGADDLQNGAYVVNVGNVGGFTYMEGNDINTLNNPNVTGVGTTSQGTAGPLGTLIAISNTSDAGLGFTAQKWQNGQYIFPIPTSTGNPAASPITQSMDHVFYPLQQSQIGLQGGPGRSASISFQSGAGDSFVLDSVPQNGSGSASLLFSHPTPSVAPTFAFDGPIGGVLNVSSIPNPGALIGVQVRGTTGSTTWAYAVVGLSGNGTCHTAVSPITTITNGNATLSSSNNNFVQWYPDPGVITYNVYRTTAGGTPSTTGLIGTVYVSQMNVTPSNGLRMVISDTGLIGDGSTAPATNTCIGSVSAVGQLKSTVATGTAPLVVFSTTQVSSLNVSQLEGFTWEVPSTIGSTTPNTGKFSSVTVTGNSAISTGTASNTDLAGELAFSAATTSAIYTFVGSYTSHPECTFGPQFSPGASHVIWMSTLSTTTLQFSSDVAQTGTVSYICVGRN